MRHELTDIDLAVGLVIDCFLALCQDLREGILPLRILSLGYLSYVIVNLEKVFVVFLQV